MKYIALTLLVFLSVIACDKSDDDSPKDPVSQLPLATMTGENTFGCLINGKPFIVKNTNNQVAIYQGGGLSISGSLIIDGFTQEVNIFISESAIGNMIIVNQTYILNNNSTMKGQLYKENENCFLETSDSSNGNIRITNLDSTNFVVSGFFEFEATSNDCQQVVEITNGRFDLQYIP